MGLRYDGEGPRNARWFSVQWCHWGKSPMINHGVEIDGPCAPAEQRLVPFRHVCLELAVRSVFVIPVWVPLPWPQAGGGASLSACLRVVVHLEPPPSGKFMCSREEKRPTCLHPARVPESRCSLKR